MSSHVVVNVQSQANNPNKLGNSLISLNANLAFFFTSEQHAYPTLMLWLNDELQCKMGKFPLISIVSNGGGLLHLQTAIVHSAASYETYIMTTGSLLDEMGAPTLSVREDNNNNVESSEQSTATVHLIAIEDSDEDDSESIPLSQRVRSNSDDYHPRQQLLCRNIITQQLRSTLEHIVTVVFMDDTSDDDDDVDEFADIHISTPSGLEVGGSMEEIEVASTITLSDSCLTRTKFDYYGPPVHEVNTSSKEKAVDMLVNKSKREDDKLQRSLPQLSITITAPSPRSSKYQHTVDSLLVNHPSPIATNAKMKQWYINRW